MTYTTEITTTSMLNETYNTTIVHTIKETKLHTNKVSNAGKMTGWINRVMMTINKPKYENYNSSLLSNNISL